MECKEGTLFGTNSNRDICRTCLSSDDVKPIFESYYEDVNVADLLKICISLEVDQDDMLPKYMCGICLGDLVMAYNFRQKCKANEKFLKSQYNTSKMDEEGEKESEGRVCTIINEGSVPMYACKTCSQQFDSKNSLFSHQRRAKHVLWEKQRLLKTNIAEKFLCIFCFMEFKTRKELREHKRKQHLTCTECHSTWESVSKLKLHMRSHTKEKPHNCTYCTKSFSQRQNLKRHLMCHTGERPYMCQLCGTGFIQQTSLNEHIKGHSQIVQAKPGASTELVCPHCQRPFKLYKFYRNHIIKCHPEHSHDFALEEKEEEETKEYQCDICFKFLKSRTTLEYHKRRHGDKTYACADCGKMFFTKMACQEHYRIHTGEKPYECKVCGKRFRFVSSYEAHMLIHRGSRPYSCKECQKSFVQMGHLNTHIKSKHSDLKDHICPYCCKGFALKGNLTVHIRIHTGETPYKCPVCERGFYDSSSMKKHLKAQHTNAI